MKTNQNDSIGTSVGTQAPDSFNLTKLEHFSALFMQALLTKEGYSKESARISVQLAVKLIDALNEHYQLAEDSKKNSYTIQLSPNELLERISQMIPVMNAEEAELVRTTLAEKIIQQSKQAE